ncbi:hypothetical protein [Kribbella sp. DT2]|uniref:hypothetical protein n=1 Tax=Kribbella sp. DT2 TaxID=3393427 RepID=UPI003CEE3F3C
MTSRGRGPTVSTEAAISGTADRARCAVRGGGLGGLGDQRERVESITTVHAALDAREGVGGAA